jgi:preprotein translocase subunit YajC
MLASGDRVKVRGTEGRVVGAQADGKVYVKLDSGTACTFDVAEVEALPVEAKAWPPAGIETK